jgi:hypothetical protein
MKIKTAKEDAAASAEIYYNPSEYFKSVVEEYGLENEDEEDKSIYNEMARNIANFIDILEIVNIDFNASEFCFNKAIEGLIRGIAAEISLNYDNKYDENMPLEELLANVKRRVYKDRKYMTDNNYFMDEEPEEEESSHKNNVLRLVRKDKQE